MYMDYERIVGVISVVFTIRSHIEYTSAWAETEQTYLC